MSKRLQSSSIKLLTPVDLKMSRSTLAFMRFSSWTQSNFASLTMRGARCVNSWISALTKLNKHGHSSVGILSLNETTSPLLGRLLSHLRSQRLSRCLLPTSDKPSADIQSIRTSKRADRNKRRTMSWLKHSTTMPPILGK